MVVVLTAWWRLGGNAVRCAAEEEGEVSPKAMTGEI